MPKKKSSSKSQGRSIEAQLVSNMIELQKVHVSMAEKFEKLSEQISSLLALFEMSARSFAKNPQLQVGQKDSEFLDKIDKLLEQNKTIAKGLTLMEAKLREKMYGTSETEPGNI